MMSLVFISTTANIFFCFVVSIVFLYTLNPGAGNCSMNMYEESVTFSTFLLIPFVVWAFISNGSMRRVRRTFWRISSYFYPDAGSDLNKPLTQIYGKDEISLASSVFNLFFDRWVLVALVDALFIFLIQFDKKLNNSNAQSSGDEISTFFQIWASSRLFNDTIGLFRGSHPVIEESFALNSFPQKVLIYSSGSVAVALIFILGFGVDNTTAGFDTILFSTALRFTIHVYQIYTFASLISLMDKFNNELLEAVVATVSVNQTAPNRLDYAFRSNSQLDHLRQSLNLDAQPIEASTPTSNANDDTGSEADSVQMKGPRSDYSQVYSESEKISDLLKMLATLIFISTVYDVARFITLITVNFTGNLIITRTLKLTLFLLPWFYLMGYKMFRGTNAVQNARRACVCLLLAATWIMMTIIGGYLGCTFLIDTTFNQSLGKQFLLYLVKTSALPTTVSLAFAVITSPGIRTWFRLPWLTRYFLVPLLWLPQFSLQELHEASGANFVLLGLLHAVGWIIMVCIGMFDLFQFPVMFATVSGVVMLVLAIKLLWPPGKAIPFVTPTSWLWYRRLDAFLRDSKYGSYHIYLAYSVIAMFILHGIFKIHFSYSWYFLFTVWALIVMLRSHPAKRFMTFQPLHLAGIDHDKLTILNKAVTPIRGKGLCQVVLDLKLPTNVNLESLSGCGDVIIIQNRSILADIPWLSYFYRAIETAHYFSVVGIQLLESAESDELPTARVTLMIQKTSRAAGASTALVEELGGSGKINYGVRVIGFMKSNSLEALYSPCLIAFGYESGSAAFCSIMKERMRMRLIVETSSKRVKVSELTDLCIIWCQFMRRPRGRELAAADLVTAIKELVAFQEFLYSNSGGRGVKMLFVCTGVPPEWTPDPECIIHRTNPMEGEVSTALGVAPFKAAGASNDRPSWSSPPMSLVTDPTLYSPRLSRVSQANRANSVGSALRNSVGSALDWGLRPSLLRASFTGDVERKTSTRLSTNLASIDEETSKDGSGDVQLRTTSGGLNPMFESTSRVSRVLSPNLIPFSGSNHPSTDAPVKSVEISVPSQNENPFSVAPPLTSNEGKHEARRSSLFAVPHHFNAKKMTPIETLLNVQSKEESWIPLRHALGSHWKTFQSTLDTRIGAALNWLNHPGGPDYTSLFITEHQSDVALLREFKYSEVYDEVNLCIIEHQLKYCKNPSQYISGAMDYAGDGDPKDPAPISCAVLYSGDYATSKREHLNDTVNCIQTAELTKRVPAALQFIPDA